MKDLLAQYSISEIVVFVVLLIFAIKELVSIVDWVRERLKKIYDKDYHAQEEKAEIEREIKDLNKFYGERKKVDDSFEEINQAIASINAQINMLIDSDKEDIKSFITREHHYFVYTRGWIDDYSMDCLEKRFAIYDREHGNSFIEDLMNELRNLPKHPPINIEHKCRDTAELVNVANE